LPWGMATIEWGNDIARRTRHREPKTGRFALVLPTSHICRFFLRRFSSSDVGEWNRRRRERRALQHRLRCVIRV
jgi:hypothetical protein